MIIILFFLDISIYWKMNGFINNYLVRCFVLDNIYILKKILYVMFYNIFFKRGFLKRNLLSGVYICYYCVRDFISIIIENRF